MQGIDIYPVRRGDIPLLHDALRQLSAALGDCHQADFATLEESGFGPCPAYHAFIAQKDGQAVGALVSSPLFSTTRGGAGLYVSDLWVAPVQRRRGLAQELLVRAIAAAQTKWGMRFVKLAVYDENLESRAFYRRLGFADQQAETNMTLHGAALDRLKGMT